MKTQVLLAVSLAASTASTTIPARRSSNPAVCRRSNGIYDICDTEHSFVRCNGHEAILVADCKIDKSNYCQILNGRGRCDGHTPPDLDDAPSCDASSSAAPSASGGLTRG